MKRFIIVFISLVLLFFLSIIFIVNNNRSYEDSIFDIVSSNYSKDISYVNKYLDNYIVKTKDKVVVLNSDFEEINSMNINDLYEYDFDLVYRKNTIMYEDITVYDDKVIYTYYSVSDGKEIDKVEIEG